MHPKHRVSPYRLLIAALLFALTANLCLAQTSDHHHHHMTVDEGGMVMHENRDRLPAGCKTISGDHKFTVVASVEHAAPGKVFGLSQHNFSVPACARLTVRFENNDEVRHQWMVHGLPRYLYPGGMFHIEAAGGHAKTGTFIVPSENHTYLVHCDMAQHMEMGMKGQLKVAGGNGDLWSVPTVSAAFSPDYYVRNNRGIILLLALSTFMGVFIAFFIAK